MWCREGGGMFAAWGACGLSPAPRLRGWLRVAEARRASLMLCQQVAAERRQPHPRRGGSMCPGGGIGAG